MQQLSELLAPARIQVTAAALTTAETQGTRELRVVWTAAAAASTPLGGTPVGAFNVSSQRQYAEAAPRQRSLDIAPGRILVTTVDRNSQLKSWSVMLDPRVLRSEGPGPDGTLTGQTILQDRAEFAISIPDDPNVAELRLFEPRLNGSDYTLTPVGTIVITR